MPEVISAEEFNLQRFLGKWVVLYFYPKDNTPGCTIEACEFKNLRQKFLDLNVEIVGVSPDTVESHRKFRQKYDLGFYLVSDPNRILIEKFDCKKEKTMFGKKFISTKRNTFILDPQGNVVKKYVNVNPLTNPKEVLEDIVKLQKSQS